jgi:ribonuclease HI
MGKPKVIIYCDGACLGNPGPGGYAALLMHEHKMATERVIFGSTPHTTNNQMELTAALEGLKALKRACVVHIFTDSQYLIKGMTEWMFNWQKNGFKTAAKKNIANIDLWQELWKTSQNHEITWRWVKGHSGHPLNDRVDEIAREQALLAQHQILGAR